MVPLLQLQLGSICPQQRRNALITRGPQTGHKGRENSGAMRASALPPSSRVLDKTRTANLGSEEADTS